MTSLQEFFRVAGLAQRVAHGPRYFRKCVQLPQAPQ